MSMKQATALANPDLALPDQSLQMRPDDLSGTPMALIEAVRIRGCLEFRDELDQADVLIEFPFGPIPQEQTGFTGFVRLRSGAYALVR